MSYGIVDLGKNLENLVNYTSGSLCSLSQAAEQTVKGNNFIKGSSFNVSTVYYLNGRRFKVVPSVNFRLLRPPPPRNLIDPGYNAFLNGAGLVNFSNNVKEFVIVSPIEDDDKNYAVLREDYDPFRVYSSGDLRYIGSLLSMPLQKDDALNHRVLVASFDGDKPSLRNFLEKMDQETKGQFYVNVDISRTDSSSFTTCTLQRFKSRNTDV